MSQHGGGGIIAAAFKAQNGQRLRHYVSFIPIVMRAAGQRLRAALGLAIIGAGLRQSQQVRRAPNQTHAFADPTGSTGPAFCKVMRQPPWP